MIIWERNLLCCEDCLLRKIGQSCVHSTKVPLSGLYTIATLGPTNHSAKERQPSVMMKNHLRLMVKEKPRIEKAFNTELNADKEFLFHKELNVDVNKRVGKKILILKSSTNVAYVPCQIEVFDETVHYTGRLGAIQCGYDGDDIVIHSDFTKNTTASDIEKSLNQALEKALIVRSIQNPRFPSTDRSTVKEQFDGHIMHPFLPIENAYTTGSGSANSVSSKPEASDTTSERSNGATLEELNTETKSKEDVDINIDIDELQKETSEILATLRIKRPAGAVT